MSRPEAPYSPPPVPSPGSRFSRYKFPTGFGGGLAALAIFALLGFLVFHRALTLGFLADDAWALYFSQGNWFYLNQESAHYPPWHFAIYYQLLRLFHLNPMPYHAFQLFLTFVNAMLVKVLAEELGLEAWKCWTAGLLMLFNSVAAEAYLWFCIVNTVMMTGLVVVGLICLLRFRRGGTWGWGVGYLAMFCLAASTDGKGMILPLLGYLLDRGWDGPEGARPQSPPGGLRIHLLSFGLLSGMFLFRWVAGLKSQTISLPLGEKWRTLTTTFISTLFHGVDDHLWGLLKGVPGVWVIIPPLLWLLGLALLLWGWKCNQGQDRRRFFTLVLLWIASCLPHSLGANLQFRYFYLPGVFAALVIVELLGCLQRRLSGSKRYLWVGLVILAYLWLDIRALQLALNSFQEASRIYDAGIKEIRERLPAIPPGTHLILIDFPMFIYSQQGHGGPRRGHIPYVYIFPQALPYQLRLFYPTADFQVSLVKLAPASTENPRPLGDPVTPAELRSKLGQPGALGFRFLPGRPPRFINLESGLESPRPTEAQPGAGPVGN